MNETLGSYKFYIEEQSSIDWLGKRRANPLIDRCLCALYTLAATPGVPPSLSIPSDSPLPILLVSLFIGSN